MSLLPPAVLTRPVLTRAAMATAMVVTAIAVTTTVTVVTSSADAASASAGKSATSLSIRGSMSYVKPARAVQVGGVLTVGGAAAGRQSVYLDASVGGRAFSAVGTSATNSAGQIKFVVRPGVTTRYMLVFRGTARLAAARSAVVMIRVL